MWLWPPVTPGQVWLVTELTANCGKIPGAQYFGSEGRVGVGLWTAHVKAWALAAMRMEVGAKKS